MHVTISGDLKENEKEALRQIKKTSVVVFNITRSWLDDKRAQREWAYACKLQKPMIYLIDGGVWLQPCHFTPNLIATINNYGDQRQNSNYLVAILNAWRKEYHL